MCILQSNEIPLEVRVDVDMRLQARLAWLTCGGIVGCLGIMMRHKVVLHAGIVDFRVLSSRYSFDSSAALMIAVAPFPFSEVARLS